MVTNSGLPPGPLYPALDTRSFQGAGCHTDTTRTKGGAAHHKAHKSNPHLCWSDEFPQITALTAEHLGYSRPRPSPKLFTPFPTHILKTMSSRKNTRGSSLDEAQCFLSPVTAMTWPSSNSCSALHLCVKAVSHPSLPQSPNASP